MEKDKEEDFVILEKEKPCQNIYWDSENQEFSFVAYSIIGSSAIQKINIIVDTVLKEMSIDKNILMEGFTRKDPYPDARSMISFIIRYYFKNRISVEVIGSILNRDHSSVSSAVKRHNKYVSIIYNANKTKGYYCFGEYVEIFNSVMKTLDGELSKIEEANNDILDLNKISVRDFMDIMKKNGIDINTLEELPPRVKSLLPK